MSVLVEDNEDEYWTSTPSPFSELHLDIQNMNYAIMLLVTFSSPDWDDILRF